MSQVKPPQSPVLRLPIGESGTLPVPLIYSGKGLLAMAKPAGVSLESHPMEEGVSSLVEGLATLVKAKPEKASAYALERPLAVYHLDAEATGLALIACDKDAAAYWRELLGSSKMSFRFIFLARGEGAVGEVFKCDLPLATHRSEPRLLVSHSTGKQSETVFTCLERWGEWALWEAKSLYPRLHQVRLHAAECLLGISGERCYTQTPLLYLSQFKRRYQGKAEEKPLYDSLALHLESVIVEEEDGETTTFRCELPAKMTVLLRKLAEYTR